MYISVKINTDFLSLFICLFCWDEMVAVLCEYRREYIFNLELKCKNYSVIGIFNQGWVKDVGFFDRIADCPIAVSYLHMVLWYLRYFWFYFELFWQHAKI